MRDIGPMQFLEVLEVQSRLQVSPTSNMSSLTLKHLRALELSVDTPNLCFLSNIVCTSGLSLHLTIRNGFLDGTVFSSVFDTTTRFISQKESPSGIKTVILYAHNPRHLSIRFWPRILPPDKTNTRYSDSTCLELTFYTEEYSDLMAVCNSIVQSSLVSELDTLLLYFGPSQWSLVSMPTLREVFSTSESVRIFIADEWPTSCIHGLLTAQPPEPPDKLIFPNLQKVVMEKVVSDAQQWR